MGIWTRKTYRTKDKLIDMLYHGNKWSAAFLEFIVPHSDDAKLEMDPDVLKMINDRFYKRQGTWTKEKPGAKEQFGLLHKPHPDTLARFAIDHWFEHGCAKNAVTSALPDLHGTFENGQWVEPAAGPKIVKRHLKDAHGNPLHRHKLRVGYKQWTHNNDGPQNRISDPFMLTHPLRSNEVTFLGSESEDPYRHLYEKFGAPWWKFRTHGKAKGKFNQWNTFSDATRQAACSALKRNFYNNQERGWEAVDIEALWERFIVDTDYESWEPERLDRDKKLFLKKYETAKTKADMAAAHEAALREEAREEAREAADMAAAREAVALNNNRELIYRNLEAGRKQYSNILDNPQNNVPVGGTKQIALPNQPMTIVKVHQNANCVFHAVLVGLNDNYSFYDTTVQEMRKKTVGWVSWALMVKRNDVWSVVRAVRSNDTENIYHKFINYDNTGKIESFNLKKYRADMSRPETYTGKLERIGISVTFSVCITTLDEALHIEDNDGQDGCRNHVFITHTSRTPRHFDAVLVQKPREELERNKEVHRKKFQGAQELGNSNSAHNTGRILANINAKLQPMPTHRKKTNTAVWSSLGHVGPLNSLPNASVPGFSSVLPPRVSSENVRVQQMLGQLRALPNAKENIKKLEMLDHTLKNYEGRMVLHNAIGNNANTKAETAEHISKIKKEIGVFERHIQQHVTTKANSQLYNAGKMKKSSYYYNNNSGEGPSRDVSANLNYIDVPKGKKTGKPTNTAHYPHEMPGDLRVINSPGDGACMFYSALIALKGGNPASSAYTKGGMANAAFKEKALDLRTRVVDWVSKKLRENDYTTWEAIQSNAYNRFKDGLDTHGVVFKRFNLKKYREDMSKPGTWGSTAELVGISEVLNVCISVLNKDLQPGYGEFYPRDQCHARIFIRYNGDATRATTIRGDHYDAVVLKNVNRQRILPGKIKSRVTNEVNLTGNNPNTPDIPELRGKASTQSTPNQPKYAEMINKRMGRQPGSEKWRTIAGQVLKMAKSDACKTSQKTKKGVAQPFLVNPQSDGAVDNTDTIFYTVDRNGIVNAFLLAKWHMAHPTPYLETTAVCSDKDRGGQAKLVIFQSLAEARRRGCKVAKLDSLNHVKDYYTRFGYVQNTTRRGNTEHGWPFVKNLTNKRNDANNFNKQAFKDHTKKNEKK